jgi:hypothetical protein
MSGTSNSYAFQLSLGEISQQALGRIGLPRGEISAHHVRDAEILGNLILSEWSNQEPNLWLVDTQVVPLVVGQAVYVVPPTTINILDAYVTLNAGTAYAQDLIIMPLSRSDYAAMPNKMLPGRTSQFWYDRLIAPTITLWPVPNLQNFILTYYRTRRAQDAVMANADTVELPYRFMDAYVAEMAARLAITYAPEKAGPLAVAAAAAYQKASNQDVEDVPIYISPSLSGYYR